MIQKLSVSWGLKNFISFEIDGTATYKSGVISIEESSEAFIIHYKDRDFVCNKLRLNWWEITNKNY